MIVRKLPVMVGLLLASIGVFGTADDAPQPRLESEIQILISQLGADQYATREKAQSQLERIGIAAFDALHLAQDHDDIEIALRARYLLRALPINWSRDSDPESVRVLLRAYGEQSESDRSARIDQLNSLDDGIGMPALCRLTRFETSYLLAKQAALHVLRYRPSLEATATFALMVDESLGSSRRNVADWLRTYTRTLVDPSTAVADWNAILTAELATLAQFPDRSSPIVMRDLLRWQIDQLSSLSRLHEVPPLIAKMLTLNYSSEKEVEDTIDWLLANRYFADVESFVERSAEKYNQSAVMLYLLAQVQKELGKSELSQKTSQLAWEKSGNQVESRNPIAERLRDRGLFEWAEREFRQILTLCEVDHPYNLFARFVLAEMLHDLQREREAGEVMQVLVEECERNAAIAEKLSRVERDPASVKSRMHYFFALDAARSGRRDDQMRHLQEAISNDPLDADVLIAMYRLPMADDAWQKNTLHLVREANEEYLKEIGRCETRFARLPEREREEEAMLWAKQCNQFAWLVGNTEGDFDQAIAFSRKSIELRRPRDVSGYYDTLARCHYAKQDLDSAIKYQRQALKLDPHSGQLRRQLALFETERAQHDSKDR